MISLVWFKRDLRIDDHGPLAQAARQGAVLPLYIIEPDYWQQPDTSVRQWLFIEQSLQLLDPLTFEDFLKTLNAEVAPTLRVDCVRLVLESVQSTYVSSVAYALGSQSAAGPTGIITVTGNTDTNLNGKTLALTATYDTSNGQLTWACTAGSTNGIAAKFLPASCKSSS